jgi:hypothetical protein
MRYTPQHLTTRFSVSKIISALTQTAMKFVPRWLSVRSNVHERTVKIQNAKILMALTQSTME